MSISGGEGMVDAANDSFNDDDDDVDVRSISEELAHSW